MGCYPGGNASYQKSIDYMQVEADKPMLGTKVDVVFVGSCTNSRMTDLRNVARILDGKQVADNNAMQQDIIARQTRMEATGPTAVVRRPPDRLRVHGTWMGPGRLQPLREGAVPPRGYRPWAAGAPLRPGASSYSLGAHTHPGQAAPAIYESSSR